MKLTKSQLEGVENDGGNVLINSSAGSGKSSVFTARIATLIGKKGVDPESILGLTFTNEAADNMKKKLIKIVGKTRAEKVYLSTFHSFAYRFLKQNFPSEYGDKKIIQQWWKMQTVYDIIGEKSSRNPNGLDLNVRVGDMLGFISYQKANMVLPEDDVIVDDNVRYIKEIDKEYLQQAYVNYCNAVRNARVLDFDDMLVDFYYKLKNNPELANGLKNKYQYVMADEFQDTNSVNIEILKLITDNNLFVVGDFRQGIYGFINANIDNILEFTNNFPDVKVIELADNFRSTHAVVEICNDLIDASPVSSYKAFSEAFDARGINGRGVSIKTHRDATVASDDIIDTIQNKMKKDDLEFRDFCVLCRTNAELGDFESVFADHDIPVDISSSKSYFDRKDIADLLAYAEHALDENDDMSLRRVFNSPNRFISKAVIANLDEYSFNNSMSLENSIGSFNAGSAQSRLVDLRNLMQDLRRKTDMNASKFLKLVYKLTNFEEHITKKATSYYDFEIRKEAVERLFEMSKKFTDIKMFLDHVSVIKNNNKKSKNAVNIMTVHASKGLEFNTVFVPNCDEEVYPHKMNTSYEEERRLLYVALSRAKDELYVSTNVFESGKQKMIHPSPFLIDIAKDDLKKSREDVVTGADSSEFIYSSNREKD